MVTRSNKGLQAVTVGYKRLPGVTKVTGVSRGYKK